MPKGQIIKISVPTGKKKKAAHVKLHYLIKSSGELEPFEEGRRRCCSLLTD